MAAALNLLDALPALPHSAFAADAALSEAARNGIGRVKAHLLADNDGVRRLLSSLDLPLRRGHDDGKECWTVDISGLTGR